MQRRFWTAALAVSALVASGLTAGSLPARADDHSLGRMGDHIRLARADTSGTVLKDRWLVEVGGPTVTDGGTAASVTARQDAVVKAAATAGVAVRPSHRYATTLNAIAVTMTAQQAATMATVPGVTGIHPVLEVAAPTTTGSRPAEDQGAAMSGAAIVRDDLRHDGRGIKVGIIDTGVDIDHPDLGGSGTHGATRFPTSRIRYGQDFVGDAFDASVPGSVPVPDAVPDDCAGHGTHVAGIVGADGNPATGGVKGIAPKVTLGAYRIFGCQGTTTTELIIAALDRAASDGMGGFNVSLGGELLSWPDYPTAKVTDAMARRGIAVTAAAGNEAAAGIFGVKAPGVGHHTISVASYENTAVTTRSLLVGADALKVGYLAADGAALPPTEGSLGLVAAGETGTAAGQGCVAPATAYPSRTAVLIERGGCAFRDKALLAQAAGAAAVVLYNTAPGTIDVGVDGDPAVTIPVVMTSQEMGQAVRSRIAAGDGILTWSNGTVSSPSITAGQVTSTSSYGLAADLTLKPDLGAPGGNIWSTYPLEKGAHASLSGTSMAAPHVAGSIALMMRARPALRGRPAQVPTLLQNTARHDAPWALDPASGLVEPVLRQGAGLVQVDRALLSSQSVSPAKISLGDDQSAAHTTVLTFTNTTRRPVVYTLRNQSSIGALGTSNPDFHLMDANVTMPTRVVVPPRGSRKVPVRITAPTDAPQAYLYGGWIEATSPTASTLSVPYVGMAGDHQRVPVLSAPGSALPCLGSTGQGDDLGPTCLDEPTGRTYSMTPGDQPTIVYGIEYPAEQITIRVFRATADGRKGALVGTFLDQTHVPRMVGQSAIAWDGSATTPGRRPRPARVGAGSYILEMAALRPLGRANVPADWERWTSPAFTVTFAGTTSGPGR